MQLTLVHHGAAVPPDVDPLRPLTATGRAEVERLAAEAARLGVHPELVWHSGKLRARQTAEAWWRACNPFATMTAARGLQPTESPRLALAAIAATRADLVIVGHQPHLARLLGSLLTGDPDASAPFPLHGCVCLEHVRDAWRERWRLGAESGQG